MEPETRPVVRTHRQPTPETGIPLEMVPRGVGLESLIRHFEDGSDWRFRRFSLLTKMWVLVNTVISA